MTSASVYSFNLPKVETAVLFIDQLDLDERILISDPPQRLHCTYYDTFDWRLHSSGCQLAGEASDDGTVHTVLYRSADGLELLHLPVPPQRYVADFPIGPLRKQLRETVGIRALLPIAEVHLEALPHHLVDKRGKQRLKLTLLHGETNRPDSSARQRLPAHLRIEAIKGYENELDQILDAVRQLSGAGATGDLFATIVQQLGLTPGAYQAKLQLQLEPETGAAETMRLILRHLLLVMEQNLPGTIENLDPEFLHDFRVALRRSRSVWSQSKAILSDQARRTFSAQLKWLGQVTGPTRDLDVYLQVFPTYQQSLPPEVRNDLDPLLAFLQKRQKQEQEALARTLASLQVRERLDTWWRYLESAPETTAPESETPIVVIARRRIWKLYQRFINDGRVLAMAEPDEQLHRLRISGKKLRYLLEFFRSLFPNGPMTRLIRATRDLQDYLGELNDLRIQQIRLQDFSAELKNDTTTPAATLVAIGRLVQNLADRQQQLHDAFPARFAAFDRGRLRLLFEKLFAP